MILCTGCYKRPPRPNKTKCAECRIRLTEYEQKRVARRRLLGLCIKCGDVRYLKFVECEHCHNVNAKRRKVRQHDAKLEAINAYGGLKCSCPECPYVNNIPAIQFATLDHINNDGAKHRREVGVGLHSGKTFYKYLKEHGYPAGLQVMCFNCNCGRQINGGLCPHLLKSYTII